MDSISYKDKDKKYINTFLVFKKKKYYKKCMYVELTPYIYMYVYVETTTSVDNSFTAKAKARQLWGMTKKQSTPKIPPQSQNTPKTIFINFSVLEFSMFQLVKISVSSNLSLS